MSAPITLVVPVYKGDLSQAAAISDAVWAAMPPRRRVAIDYGDYFRCCRCVQEEGASSDPVPLRERARTDRGVILAPSHPLPAYQKLAVGLRDLGVGVLITRQWVLGHDRELLQFIHTSGCSVVAWVAADREPWVAHAAELVGAIGEAAGDRLLTLHPPMVTEESLGVIPGRTLPAVLHPEEPLPRWLLPVVLEHVGLPVHGQ